MTDTQPLNTSIPLRLDKLDEAGRATSMYLREEIMSGTYGDHKIAVSRSLTGAFLFIEVNDRIVQTDLDSVLNKIINEVLGIVERGG